MKKIKLFSLLMAFCLSVGTMWAAPTTESVSISTYATANSWSSGTAYATVVIDANVTATGLTNGNNSKYYSSNSSWRHYEGDNGTITIATTSGTLSSVTFTYTGGNNGVIKNGSTTVSSGSACSISGTSVTFNVGHSTGTKNGNVQITAISVTYEAGSSSSACATPSFSPAAGAVLSGTTVAISSTAGATIYYTMGADPADPTTSSTQYTEPIEITEATTIKALAVKDGLDDSEVATASYTILTPIATISEFLTEQPDPATYVQFSGTVVVTGVNGKNVYVQDEEGNAICLYFSNNSSWTKGHKVTGLFKAKYGTYGNQKQMVIAAGDEGTIAATEDAVMPAATEINTLATATINANMNKYVTLKSVYFQAQSLTSKSVDLKDANTNTLKFYDNLGQTTGKVLPLTATGCDVTGVLISYVNSGNPANEILPVDAACIVAGNATLPTLDPAGSTDAENPTMVKNGSNVTVTPASDFTCTLNSASLTSATNVPITDTENNTEIVVTAARDYYTTTNATYYFKANPPAPKYAITVTQPASGGTLEASYTEAEEDFEVTLTATPTNAHFTFNNDWVVCKTGEPGTTVEVSENKFTMPAYAVTVTGSFTEDAKVTFSFAKGAEAATGDVPAAIANKYAEDVITLPACPFTNTGYAFGGWKHSGTEAIHQPGDYTVTAADAAAGAITFTAQWKKLYTVTWNVNGDESVTTEVANGDKPTFPEAPESCDATSTNFYGWATAAWEGKTDDISAKTIYTKASDMPAINNADVKYYAVFCVGGIVTGGITQEEITTDANADTGTSGQYANRTYASASGNWTGKFAYNTQNEKKVMQINATSGNSIVSPTFGGNISKIEIVYKNASGDDRTFYLKNGDNSLGTITATASTNEGTEYVDVTGSYTSFTITASGALYIYSISVTYGTEASNYMTTCTYAVTLAEDIENGTVSLTVEGESDPLELPASLAQGTVVNVTATPTNPANYKLTALTAGEEIILSTKKFTVGTAAVEVSATFSEKETLDADVFKWSADAATVQIAAAEKTYPTLTNELDLDVTFDSSDKTVATIASATSYSILKVGSTTISAIFAGDDTYKPKTVVYVLTVAEGGGTAVENVETSAKAVKVLKNGLLLIEKNGRTYNAQGQVVK